MGDIALPGNPPIEVKLRISARARRITLRVSRLDGRVTLTMPRHVPEKQGYQFAMERRAWIAKQLSSVGGVVVVKSGVVLPVEGQMKRVVLGSGDAEPGEVAAATAAKLGAQLKERARERLIAAVDEFAGALGRQPTGITLRDPRSRWGSCSSAGRLMFSWRLIFAPPDVLRYVAAHEVAHLRHMDHSPAFWATVDLLFPDYDSQRIWLRHNGTELHRYKFGH